MIHNNVWSLMQLHNMAKSGFCKCGGTRYISGGDDVFFMFGCLLFDVDI